MVPLLFATSLLSFTHTVFLSLALVSIPLKSSNWKVLLGPRSFNGEMYISIDQTTYPILASSSRLLEAPTFTVLAVQYLLASIHAYPLGEAGMTRGLAPLCHLFREVYPCYVGLVGMSVSQSVSQSISR